MTDKTLDLLLAAQVLEFAAGIRRDAWNAFATAAGINITDAAAMQNWRNQHPVSEFVPTALASLDDIAAQIAAIRSSSH